MAKSTLLKRLGLNKESILHDYYLSVESREVSVIGRKEVFMGKAKFGIFGGGKELAQVAMAHFFNTGDWRSGYYRDQTLMFAIGEMTPQQLFAQLYAHTDLEKEIISAGRLMTGHFGTKMVDKDGSWLELSQLKNSTTDISPTAAQMPRLVGLGYASKLYRENKDLHQYTNFSNKGNEIAWGTIGNASTSEGHFLESINAAGVLQIPMFVSIWDDGYGISVPAELHTTKSDISEVLKGFQIEKNTNGLEIIKARGWNYLELLEAYEKGEKICREKHVPVMLHVTELTQPQGHSTSGSHERYKPKERLDWEQEFDCVKKMREWLIEDDIASEEEIIEVETRAKKSAKDARNRAWKEFTAHIKKEGDELKALIENIQPHSRHQDELDTLKNLSTKDTYPYRSTIIKAAREALRLTVNENIHERELLLKWYQDQKVLNHERFSSKLYSEYPGSTTNIEGVPAEYDDDSPMVDGRQVLQAFFDLTLKNNPLVFAFGEDVGKIGDVNQGFAGLQEKHGELRVTDTGIREATIVGQAIGAAFRGLRPIAEIQYVDYLMYAIQIMSDDLATVQYRSFGQQKSPAIIRTRGHRLEGVWHSGSPMGAILHSLRGIFICVPRDMTQAAGMYNTLLAGEDPGLVVECLNGYRLKERLPINLGEFKVPLGQAEILREGEDITIVTYGSMCRICLDGADQLAKAGISAEVIDVQTLIPFDRAGIITESLKKTNRILFADEDVPGGATAYMMYHVLEEQGGYYHLDSKPKTINSWAHRPAYGTDGDYFSKPNAEDVFDYCYEIVREAEPDKYPSIY